MAGTGCGGDVPDSAVASPPPVVGDLARIRGPWAAQPFGIDPAIAAAADRRCRTAPDSPVRPNLQLVLVDARGDSRIDLLYRSADGTAECVVEVAPDGEVVTRGLGSGNSGLGGLGPTELQMMNTTWSGSGPNDPGDTSVIGSAGLGIVVVRIVRPNGETMLASVGGGRFAAWWPVFEERFRIEGYDANGTLVAEMRQ